MRCKEASAGQPPRAIQASQTSPDSASRSDWGGGCRAVCSTPARADEIPDVTGHARDMTPLQGFGMYLGGPNPGFAARAITFCPCRAARCGGGHGHETGMAWAITFCPWRAARCGGGRGHETGMARAITFCLWRAAGFVSWNRGAGGPGKGIPK
jgi:hypothetical protein